MATKETKDGLGYIIQAISNIVEPKVADLRYDKTYRAKVTEKVEAGIYKVKINGREYQLEYKGDLNVEDIVRVKAPLNNFSDIYIEAEPSTGGGSGGTSDYDDLFNKPILNTNNTEAQPVNEKETIKGTIKLHKVSKTGNYNDLNNKPSLDFIPISEKGVANGVATLGTNSKVVSSQLPIASTSELGTIKVGANLNITEDGTLNVLTSSDTVSDTLPIGSIVKWGSYTAPKNWLLCNGQELKRNEYPDLFAAIGTTYGEGNGSTTFNLPNMSSKFSVGYNNSDSDFNSLGKTGGEKTHTLTIAEMPAHTHKTWISDTAYSERGDGYQNYYYGQGRYYNNTSSVGESKAHNNMPPYIVMNYIIKAKQSAGVVATVVDNLDSTSSIDALSANQGKILKGYISDNDTMITTLQEDVIKVEDDITKIKSNYIPVSQKGNPNGVATLDNNALLKDTQLPIASPTRLGGIKIGENLNITADGVLNATGGGGGGSGEKEVSISETEPTENSIELWVDLSEDEPIPDPALDSTPVGAIVPYPSDIIPEGFLECNGQAVSRTDYQELFNIIGTTYGNGDGFTTFNLPDLQGKIPVGLDENDTDFDTLGNTGGEKEHTMTLADLVPHVHNLKTSNATGSHNDGFLHNGSYELSNEAMSTKTTGGGQPFNIMQPYIVQNYIIKAKQRAGIIATVVDSLESESETDALSARQGKKLKEKVDGTALYENEVGTTGDIVLNDNLSNYKYIKIFWKVGNNNKSEEVLVTLDKNINLSLIDFIDSKIWIHTKTMLMEDTKLTVKRYKEYSIRDSSQWTPYGTLINSIAIVKVVGYK